MAVTITARELSNALRADPDNPGTFPQIERLLPVATAIVETYSNDAPDAVQNEAVVRLAGYLYDQPFAPQGQTYSNALRNSGAAAILALYRKVGAKIVDDDGTPSDTPITPSDVIFTPQSAFQFQLFNNLIAPTLTTTTAISDTGAGYTHTILNKQTAPGGIKPNEPFFVLFDGYLNIETQGSNRVGLTLHTIHKIGADLSKEFTHDREYIYDQDNNANITVPLNVFNSVSIVRLGSFGGITITQEDLDNPSEITYTLEIQLFNPKSETRKSGNLVHFTSNPLETIAYQLRQAVTTGGGGGGTGTDLPAIPNLGKFVLEADDGVLSWSAPSASDITPEQIEVIESRINQNRDLIALTQSQTVRLHQTPGTPKRITGTVTQGLLIHTDPPPTNVNGLTHADAPAQGWAANARVFVRLRKTLDRADYQVVFTGANEEPYAIVGTSWTLLDNLASERDYFYLVLGKPISNLVDTIELQQGLGNTIYDGKLGNNVITTTNLPHFASTVLRGRAGVNIAKHETVYMDGPSGGKQPVVGQDFGDIRSKRLPVGIAIDAANFNDTIEILVTGTLINVRVDDFVQSITSPPKPIYWKRRRTNNTFFTFDKTKADIPVPIGVWTGFENRSGNTNTATQVYFNFATLAQWKDFYTTSQAPVPRVSISTTAPVAPKTGDLWINSGNVPLQILERQDNNTWLKRYDLNTASQIGSVLGKRIAPVPSAGDGGKIPAVKEDVSGYELIDAPVISEKLPKPSAGDGGKIPAVKEDVSGYELIDQPSGGGATFTKLAEITVPNATSSILLIFDANDSKGIEFKRQLVAGEIKGILINISNTADNRLYSSCRADTINQPAVSNTADWSVYIAGARRNKLRIFRIWQRGDPTTETTLMNVFEEDGSSHTFDQDDVIEIYTIT